MSLPLLNFSILLELSLYKQSEEITILSTLPRTVHYTILSAFTTIFQFNTQYSLSFKQNQSPNKPSEKYQLTKMITRNS